MYDYTFEIGMDISKSEKEVKQQLGKMAKEIKESSIVLDFDYNIDIKDINKKLNALTKQFPEIPIKFKYEINEQLLEKESKKLKYMESIVNIDTTKAKKELESLNAEFVELYNSGAKGEAFDSKYSQLANKTKIVLSTLKNNGTDVNSFIKDLEKAKELGSNISEIFNNMQKNNSFAEFAVNTNSLKEQNDVIESIRTSLLTLREEMKHDNALNVIPYNKEDIKALTESLTQGFKEASDTLVNGLKGVNDIDFHETLSGLRNELENTSESFKNAFIEDLRDVQNQIEKIQNDKTDKLNVKQQNTTSTGKIDAKNNSKQATQSTLVDETEYSKLFNEISTKLNTLKENIDGVLSYIRTETSAGSIDFTKDIETIEAFKEELLTLEKSISDIKEKLDKGLLRIDVFEFDEKSLSKLNKSIETLNDSIKPIDVSVKVKFNIGNLTEKITEFKIAKFNRVCESIVENTKKLNRIKSLDQDKFKNLRQLLRKTQELSDLATIVKASETSINKAKQNVEAQNSGLTVGDSYKIMKSNLKEILSLEKQRKNASLDEEKRLIQLIEKYRAENRKINSGIEDKSRIATSEKDLQLLRDNISLVQQKNKEFRVTAKQASEAIEGEMHTVNTQIDLQISEWEELTKSMSAYKSEMLEIRKVVKNTTFDSDGNPYSTYKVTDNLGDTRTFSDNGTLMNVNYGVINEDRINNTYNQYSNALIKKYKIEKQLLDSTNTDDVVAILKYNLETVNQQLDQYEKFYIAASERGHDVNEKQTRIDSLEKSLQNDLNKAKKDAKNVIISDNPLLSDTLNDKDINDFFNKYEGLIKRKSDLENQLTKAYKNGNDLDAVFISKDLQKVEQELQQYKKFADEAAKSNQIVENKLKEIDKLMQTVNSSSNKQIEGVNSAVKAYDSLINKLETYYNLKVKLDSGGTLSGNQQTTFNNISDEITGAINHTGDYKNTGSIFDTEYASKVAEFEKKNKEAAQSVYEAWSKAWLEEKNSAVTALEQSIKSIDKLSLKSDEFEIKLKELKNTLQNGNFEIKFGMSDEEINNVQKARQEIDKTIQELKSSDYNVASQDSIAKLINKMQKDLKDNPAYSEGAKNQIKELISQVSNYGSVSKGTLKSVTAEWLKVANAEEEAGRSGNRWIDGWKKKMQGISQYLSTYFSFYYMFSKIQQQFNTIVDLDESLLDLRKTTSMTDSQLNDFYETSTSVAKQMGVTTKEILDQASAWSRLGFSSAESATRMAELSSKFSAISPGLNTDEATTGLVSVMKAFDISDKDVKSKVMDKINIVGNKFATSNAEIIEGLSQSSSAMRAANNTLEETIALFTSGQEILQNASTMGNALKTVSMRIRGYDEQTEELSGDLINIKGDIADLTKTTSTPMGVSLFTDETLQTYKSTYQILQDISKIMPQLTDKQQAQLSEKLFGKTRAQAGLAILNNFDQAEKAIQEMTDSYGSSEREMQNVTKTLTYELNKLSETWTEFSKNVLERSSLKTVISWLTNLSEVIVNVTKNVDSLSLVFGGLSTLLLKGKLGIGNRNILSGALNVGRAGYDAIKAKATGQDFGMSAFKQQIVKMRPEFSQLSNELKDEITTVSDIFNSQSQNAHVRLKTLSTGTQDFAKWINKTGREFTDASQAEALYNQYLQETSVKTKLATAGTKALSLALQTASAMIMTTVITLVFQKISSAVSEYINKAKNEAEAAEQAYSKSKEKLEQDSENLKNINELSKQYETLGEKSAKDATTRSQLLDIQYQINEAVGGQVEGLDLVNGKLDTQIAKLKEVQLEQLNTNVADSMDAYYDAKNKRDTATRPESDWHYGDYEAEIDVGYDEIVDILEKVGLKENTQEVVSVASDVLEKSLQSIITGENLDTSDIKDIPNIKDILSLGAFHFKDGFAGIGSGKYMLDLDTEDAKVQAKELFGIEDLDSVENKVKDLEGLMNIFKQNGQVDNELYRSLKNSYEYYKGYLDDVSTETKNSIENIIKQQDALNDKVLGNKSDVKTAEDYEEYTKKLKDFILADENAKKLMNDGNLSTEDIDKYVEAYVTGFDEISKAYGKYQEKIYKQSDEYKNIVEQNKKDLTKKFADFKNLKIPKDTIANLQKQLDGDQLEIVLKANTDDFEKDVSKWLEKYASTQPQDQLVKKLQNFKTSAGDFGLDSYNNVDLFNTTPIEFDNKNLEQYKSQLLSWNKDYQNILKTQGQSAADTYWQSFSKSMQGSSNTAIMKVGTFKGIDIAFNTLLNVDGKSIPLDKGTVHDYLQTVIKQACDGDGKITNEEIKKIFEIDKNGLDGFKVEGQNINGIIADIGVSARDTATKMNELGKGDNLIKSFEDCEKAAEKAGMSVEEYIKSFDSDTPVYSQEQVQAAIMETVHALEVEQDRVAYVNEIFADETAKVAEKISNLQSSITSINDAITKVNLGTLGAGDLVTLLSQFPELISYVDVTADGFGNLKQGLEDVKQARLTALIDDLRSMDAETEGEKAALNDVCNLLEQMVTYEPSHNFSDMITNLNAVEDSVGSVISAMDQLNEGTALTKAQLVDLAFQYPQLLEQANLFTDGSIQGQKNMVNSILEMSEKQYDGILDEKIAELKAENELFEGQLTLEESKRQVALQIAHDIAEGKITTQEGLVEALSKLNELESQNNVEMVNGEVVANADKVNQLLEQDKLEADNYGESLGKQLESNADTLKDMVSNHDETNSTLTDGVNKVGNNIKNALSKGASKAVSNVGTSVSKIMQTFSSMTTPLKKLASNIMNALSGKKDNISDTGSATTYSDDSGGDETLVSYVKGGISNLIKAGKNLLGKVKGLNAKSSKVNNSYKGLTIGSADATKFLESYIGSSDALTKKLQQQITANNNAIGNLESLKGLTLDKISSSGSSASPSKNSGSGNKNKGSGSGKKNKNKSSGNKNKNKNSGNKNKNKNSSSEKDASKSYDLIAIAIERVESRIESLGKTVSATYKTWGTRNSALTNQISQITKEISLQTSSYDMYMKAANNVGLASNYKKMIQNGGMSIFTTSDENLQKKIDQYKQYYDAAIACQKKAQDLAGDLASAYKSAFDNIKSEYDLILSGFKHSQTMINEYISQTETEGYLASNKYYEGLQQVEQNNIKKLNEQKTKLQNSLNNAVNKGNIAKYSEMWYTMHNEIDGVTEAIESAQTALEGYAKTIRENNWSLFDKKNDYISELTTESDFIIDLMSDKDLHDKKTGKITKEGQATQGLHAVNYNTYMAKANDYAKEISKINKEIAKDPYNTTLLERRQALLKSQQEAIKSAESEKKSIQDLAKNGYDALLQAIQKVIDKKKEQLNAEKELYNYQKQIAEKTKAVSNYQKQLSAYEGDTSEEAKAVIQKLTVSLEDAQTDLKDTEYDKYISDQSNIMDKMYSQLEEHLNLLAEDIKTIIAQVIDATNANSDTINETIHSATEEVGYTLTEEMTAIWNPVQELGKNIQNVVATYSNNFDTKMTSVITIISGIKKHLDDAKLASDKKAANKVNSSKTSSSSGSSKVKVSTPKTNTSKTTSKTTSKASSSKSSSSSSKTSSSKTKTSSSSSSSGKSTAWSKGIFTNKKSVYPKQKLRKEISIVDRLKYYDFASGYSYRKKYYAAMGGSGSYRGTSSQNQWMIKQMKSHGFAKGGTIGSAIKKTGEDGFILARTGEEVLSLEKIKEMQKVLALTNELCSSKIDNIAKDVIKNGDNYNHVDKINVEFNLPNVTNYDDFIKKAQADKKFENIVKQVTLGSTGLNSNSLTKYKF